MKPLQMNQQKASSRINSSNRYDHEQQNNSARHVIASNSTSQGIRTHIKNVPSSTTNQNTSQMGETKLLQLNPTLTSDNYENYGSHIYSATSAATGGGGFFTNKNYQQTYQQPFSNITQYELNQASSPQQNQQPQRHYINDTASYSSSCRKLNYEGGLNHQVSDPALRQVLEDTIINSTTDWINIQPVVRQTFKHFFDFMMQQVNILSSFQDQISQQKSLIQDQQAQLLEKADLQDVSKIVMEVAQQSLSTKDDLEELKKQIGLKMTRQECLTQLKSQLSMIDELKKQEFGSLRSLITQQSDEAALVRDKVDEIKRDQSKKLAQIYRELEKSSISLERKVSIEEFNERIDGKADKQQLVNSLMAKANKGEAEQLVLAKIGELAKQYDASFAQQGQKIDLGLSEIEELLSKKASTDEIHYYRKELQFKLDKSDLDSFRQEYVERIATIDQKLNERNQLMQQFRDTLETKLDQQIQVLKAGLHKKIEQKAELSDLQLLKNDLRQHFEKVNDQLLGFKQEQLQKLENQLTKVDLVGQALEQRIDQVQDSIDVSYQEVNRIKEQIKFLSKERAEDVDQISELMKATQKKITQEVTKLNKELESHIKQNHESQSNEINDLREDFERKMDQQIADKVRVDEVQDALRRLTESFQIKIENMHSDLTRTIQSKNEDCYLGMERLKSDITELQQSSSHKVTQDQIEALLTQLDFLSKDLSLKCDKKAMQAQIDFLHETLTSMNRDMLLKANIQDVMSLLDKKGNSEEIHLELGWLRTNFQKLQKENQLEKQQQNSVNEALCSENCVARYIWKTGQSETFQGVKDLVKWDLQSVNTCPENFMWKGPSITVEAPGLYEVTLAFFSKKKKPLVQVLCNQNVIVQSVSKTVCNSCGSACQVQANGHVQKLQGGEIYKISLIEFVVLPAKSQLSVVFTSLKKDMSGLLMNAEGFIGIRKL